MITRPAAPAAVEQRSKPRVTCSYPVTLRGMAEDGRRFEAHAVLSNMSAVGMYLHTKRPVQLGNRLFVVVRMSTRPLTLHNAPQLAGLGVVVRVETRADSTYGVGVRLLRHRFL